MERIKDVILLLVWCTLFSFVVLLASSCSVQNKVHRLVSKAEKILNKATVLDPTIRNEADTITVNTVTTKTDTLYTDSLIYVNTTITKTDTIYVPTPIYDFSDVKTNSQVRQEERTKRTIVRVEGKTARVTVRNENKSSVFWSAIGRAFWVFILIGAFGYWFISSKFKLFKK